MLFCIGRVVHRVLHGRRRETSLSRERRPVCWDCWWAVASDALVCDSEPHRSWQGPKSTADRRKQFPRILGKHLFQPTYHRLCAVRGRRVLQLDCFDDRPAMVVAGGRGGADAGPPAPFSDGEPNGGMDRNAAFVRRAHSRTTDLWSVARVFRLRQY